MRIAKYVVSTIAALLICVSSAFAVEFGAYSSAGCTSVTNLGIYKAWIGVPSQHVTENWSQSTGWSGLLSDSAWSIGCFATVRNSINITFGLPMLPNDGSTLALGASGSYDANFTAIATTLVANGFGHTIIRLGWEFNGNWQPWNANANPTAFVAYWQRIVGLMRAVPGADFQFEWCPNIGYGTLAPDSVYPGDAFVDIIGMDIYDAHYNAADELPAARWNLFVTESYGLQWQVTFAATHNKRISIPEWGCCGNNAGDDPYFIDQMAAWLVNNNYLYADYYDQNYNGTWQISNNQWPYAAQRYIYHFGPH
jgi:hypothetical protein